MLLVLLLVDYNVYKMQDDLGTSESTPEYAFKTKTDFRLPVKLLTVVAVTLTIIATVVSGWGEPIYNFII